MIKSIELNRYASFNDGLLAKTFITPTSFVRIKNIQGLGPVKADVSRAPSGTQPGSFLLGTRIPERVITFTLDMTTDYHDEYTLSDVRRNLQELFEPGARLEMIFELDHNLKVMIEGTVESYEPEIFVQEPFVVATVVCEHPYFKDAGTPITVPVDTTAGTIFSFTNNGRQLAPVGFEFRGTLTAAAVGPNAAYPQLSQDGPLRGFLGIPDYGFEQDDTIIFDTRRGQRAVKRIRSFATNDILGFFQGSLMDFQVLPGQNVWRWNKLTYDTRVLYTREYTGI